MNACNGNCNQGRTCDCAPRYFNVDLKNVRVTADPDEIVLWILAVVILVMLLGGIG